jgi:hypothetical protein
MLGEILPQELAASVTEAVHKQAERLARALGARLGKPKRAAIEKEVETVTRYAQAGAPDLSNDKVIGAMNSIVLTLSGTCYPPAEPLARALFDRKAGEPRTPIEVVLFAARARWDIELGLQVPIRWLAALGGVSVKTLRNLASRREIATRNVQGYQVIDAGEAARWLRTRSIGVTVGFRRVRATSGAKRSATAKRRPGGALK